jgi:hypothetical protein
MAMEVKNDRLSSDQLAEAIRRRVATELRRQGGRTPGGEELVVEKVRFTCCLDSSNLATTNVDGGVQFCLMAGDRELRIKRIVINQHVRPNTAAASASTVSGFFALAEGRGILAVPEAANTQVRLLPQCMTERRRTSSALLIRRAIADMFTVSGLQMNVQDQRLLTGLAPEPATGAGNGRRSLVPMEYSPVNMVDDYIIRVTPGQTLVIGTKNLFNAGAGINLNGMIEWEEDV